MTATRPRIVHSFGGMALAASLLVTGAAAAAAAPIERALKIELEIEGRQDWRNALQWSSATTEQRYAFSTGLRSDGELHGANLLEPDTDLRLAIKTEYLRQQGLKSLQASGIDPSSPDLQRQISSRMQQEVYDCKGQTVCMGKVNMKYARIMAAAVEPDNSELFEGPPRYRYYFGYPDCPNTIRAVHRTSVEGETAYGRKKDKLLPYRLQMEGDSSGSEQDRDSLCMSYTVVEDTLENRLYVENVNVPTATGTIKRTEFDETSQREGELPIPTVALEWVNATLRDTQPSGQARTTLPLNLPLDGNSTVLGDFTGEAKAELDWSWK